MHGAMGCGLQPKNAANFVRFYYTDTVVLSPMKRVHKLSTHTPQPGSLFGLSKYTYTLKEQARNSLPDARQQIPATISLVYALYAIPNLFLSFFWSGSFDLNPLNYAYIVGPKLKEIGRCRARSRCQFTAQMANIFRVITFFFFLERQWWSLYKA